MEKKQVRKKYQYDPLNRLVSVSVHDDYTRVYTYDPAGNRISVTSTSIFPVTGAGPAERVQTTPRSPVSAARQVCRTCGTPLIAGTKFCGSCGTPASPEPAGSAVPAAPQTPSVCPFCGSQLKPGIKFCGDCGRKLP